MPDCTLGEHLMLIQCNKLAQRFWRQALHQDGIGWAVALKDAVRRLEVWHAISLHLFGGLAKGQRLGLRKEVRHQQVMVMSERIQRLAEADKVAGNELCSLVNQLVKSVLPVRARLSPDNRPSLVVDTIAFQRHMLAIAFHVQLLEIRTQPAKVVIVGQNSHRLSAKEVVIPDAD